MIYMDHAGLGLPRQDALRQEYEYKLALSMDPSLEFKYVDIIERNKRNISKSLFHTQNYMVSYVRNTTEGITIASNVIPLNEDDEVVLSSLEHRSADNSWEYMCDKKKAKLIKVHIDPSDSSETIIGKFSKAITPKTKVVFCSHIDRNFGIEFPVKEIAKLAEQVGAYSVIDGAQAVGLVDVNLDELDCSIYICSFHKWCRMPVAMGAMLSKSRITHNLERLYVGERRLDEEDVKEKDFGTDELGTRNVALEMCLPMLIDRNQSESHENVYEYFTQKLVSISHIVKIVSSIEKNGRGFIVVDFLNNNDNLQDILFSDYGIMIGRILKDGKFFLRFSFDWTTQKNEIHILIEALKDIARNCA